MKNTQVKSSGGPSFKIEQVRVDRSLQKFIKVNEAGEDVNHEKKLTAAAAEEQKRSEVALSKFIRKYKKA